MRVRIIKQPTGTVDGVELWKLLEGRVYDIRSSLATLLIVSRSAEPVPDDRPALAIQVDPPSVVELVDPPDRDTAADRARRYARRRKRTR
jgi:hypothetical protein